LLSFSGRLYFSTGLPSFQSIPPYSRPTSCPEVPDCFTKRFDSLHIINFSNNLSIYSIIDKKPTSNNIKNYPNFPNYFPDKLLVLGKSFYEKFNELFSYKVVYLYPNKDNIKEIRNIVEFRKLNIGTSFHFTKTVS